jgi:hypothetical protein
LSLARGHQAVPVGAAIYAIVELVYKGHSNLIENSDFRAQELQRTAVGFAAIELIQSSGDQCAVR